MKIPPYRYRSPLGRLNPSTPDVDDVKERGWREERILVVSDCDERLDFVEREIIRGIGERLYGSNGGRRG